VTFDVLGADPSSLRSRRHHSGFPPSLERRAARRRHSGSGASATSAEALVRRRPRDDRVGVFARVLSSRTKSSLSSWSEAKDLLS
jgi:hypothetical protein